MKAQIHFRIVGLLVLSSTVAVAAEPAEAHWESFAVPGVNNYVFALDVHPSGKIIVGGLCGLEWEGRASSVACWNPVTTSWSPLGTGIHGTIYALAIDNLGNISSPTTCSTPSWSETSSPRPNKAGPKNTGPALSPANSPPPFIATARLHSKPSLPQPCCALRRDPPRGSRCVLFVKNNPPCPCAALRSRQKPPPNTVRISPTSSTNPKTNNHYPCAIK